MYILYLDDSGSATDPNMKHFVLGGICVPEENIRWLSSQIEEYAASIDSENPKSVEFHAAECFRGVIHPWKTLQKIERIAVIKNVLGKLNDARPGVVIMGCAIHKDSFPGQDPVALAFEDLSSRFNMFLEHHPIGDNRQRGMMIIDKCTYELGLQKLAGDFREGGNRWGSQLRSIIEVPLFVDSGSSRLVQLADHVAYAIHRRYNQDDLSYFNCIESRFDQNDGVIHGLSHKQHYTRTCTCPACISRK
jgi:hypothetical protein